MLTSLMLLPVTNDPCLIYGRFRSLVLNLLELSLLSLARDLPLRKSWLDKIKLHPAQAMDCNIRGLLLPFTALQVPLRFLLSVDAPTTLVLLQSKVSMLRIAFITTLETSRLRASFRDVGILLCCFRDLYVRQDIHRILHRQRLRPCITMRTPNFGI